MAEIMMATEADLHEMALLGQMMHDESPRFNGLGYSIEKTLKLGAALLASEDGFMLVAKQDGVAIGMVIGYVSEHFFSNDRMANELVVYVAPEHRGGTVVIRMIKKFEEWAFNRGASDIVLGVSTEVEASRTGALYQKMGYAPSGFTFVKRCT